MKKRALLSGTLLIECEGGYPETFLNLAAAQRIPLWDVRRQDLSLWCCASAAHYHRLRPVARRAQVRMRVRKKQGPVFALRRMHLRPGMVVGLFLFLALLQLFSSRVWVIRVEGNTTVSDQAICDVLAPLGIYEGADFDNTDLTAVRLTALQQLPQLTWLAVNQNGSILTVEVKERTESAPLTDDTPANLVAACDGVVLHVDTAVGQAMVKAGDAVRRGDLLISGVMDSKVGPQLKHAIGSVTARTTRTLTVTVPLAETVSVPAHTLTRTELSVFGHRIPLYTSNTITGEPTVTVEQHPLTAAGVALPLRLTHTRFHYTMTAVHTHTEAEALTLAEQRLAQQESALQGVFGVESRTVSTQTDATSVTLTATLIGTEEIALSVPIQ